MKHLHFGNCGLSELCYRIAAQGIAPSQGISPFPCPRPADNLNLQESKRAHSSMCVPGSGQRLPARVLGVSLRQLPKAPTVQSAFHSCCPRNKLHSSRVQSRWVAALQGHCQFSGPISFCLLSFALNLAIP